MRISWMLGEATAYVRGNHPETGRKTSSTVDKKHRWGSHAAKAPPSFARPFIQIMHLVTINLHEMRLKCSEAGL
jgi:hypothetical protein